MIFHAATWERDEIRAGINISPRIIDRRNDHQSAEYSRSELVKETAACHLSVPLSAKQRQKFQQLTTKLQIVRYARNKLATRTRLGNMIDVIADKSR